VRQHIPLSDRNSDLPSWIIGKIRTHGTISSSGAGEFSYQADKMSASRPLTGSSMRAVTGLSKCSFIGVSTSNVTSRSFTALRRPLQMSEIPKTQSQMVKTSFPSRRIHSEVPDGITNHEYRKRDIESKRGKMKIQKESTGS
jgi:hypothetical protein